MFTQLQYFIRLNFVCMWKTGTGGQAYFDNSHLICLVSVHKPVVRDRLNLKTGWSNGQNERDLAILHSHMRKIKIRQSNNVRLPVPGENVQNILVFIKISFSNRKI